MTDKQELFHTTNLKAATAILTHGMQKVAVSRIARDDGKDSIVFWTNGTNEEGINASQVYHWMTKGGNDAKESERKLVDQLTPAQRDLFYAAVTYYLRCYAHNRDELIGDIHKTPRMIVIEKDGRKLAISENASEETRRKISAMF